MQVEPVLATLSHPTMISPHGRPPLPQGPRTPTRSSSTPTNDPADSAIWTFSSPTHSFSAVSELVTNSPLWSAEPSTPLSSPDTLPRLTERPAILTPPPPLTFDPA